jgi:dihydrofolate reductase
MRRLFSFLMVTLDGYYEGPSGEFDFWVVDDEFDEFAAAQLDEADMLVFGRVTYEGMAAYWPTAAGQEDDPRVAERMNGLPKIVVSRTLEDATWVGTRVVSSPEELAPLKQEPGKDRLELVRTRTFDSGNVLSYYRPR